MPVPVVLALESCAIAMRDFVSSFSKVLFLEDKDSIVI